MSSSSMYKQKPIFNFPATFTHISTMYKMKNIHFNRVSDSSDLLSQENNISEDTEPHSSEKLVLARQEKLLAELSKLKNQIEVFRVEVNKLKTLKPAGAKSKPVSTSSVSEKLDYSSLLSDTATHGIVINADPNSPPYSLLGLSKIWKDLPIHVSVHVHSSVITLPEPVKSLELLPKLNSQSKSLMNITLVWKNVEDCELIISPVKSTVIVGEVNLLRFFDQYLSSESIPQNILKNELLDFAHRIQRLTGNKKLELTKQLSEKLANNDYFSNGKIPDVGDLALWSAFMKMQKKDNLPQNISKWVKRSSSYFGL